MANQAFRVYKIEDRSYLAFIKREISNMLREAGYSTHRIGEADIVLSELTSNLIKFANSGQLIYRLRQLPGNKVLDLYCLDKGPGHANIQKMLPDGLSSANTLGHGLGSINRLSDTFQIHSKLKEGTIAYVQLYMHRPLPASKKGTIAFSEIQTSVAGEEVCGDGYDIIKTGDETRIFVGDGLGHGQNAFEAVQTAIEAFKATDDPAPSNIIRYIHEKVKRTRGLVANVYMYNHQTKIWRGCGVGNIIGKLCNYTDSKNYIGYNGIIGGSIPNTITNFETEAGKYPFVIFCSDGLKSRWDLAAYQGELKQHTAIAAAAIYKDQLRGTDDATVLVGKII